MNWVNLQLQSSGHVVDNFEEDFDDGVKLCALVEALQRKKIGKVSVDIQWTCCCYVVCSVCGWGVCSSCFQSALLN